MSSNIYKANYQISIQFILLISIPDFLHSAVLHPRLGRIRDQEVKKSRLNDAEELIEIKRQFVHSSPGNDETSSITHLLSSLSASGERIELIIENPIHNQQVQHEELKKRKRNDCFFSLVNCRLVQTSLTTTSLLRQRLLLGNNNKNNNKNKSKQHAEGIHKRRTRKIIRTQL